MLAPTDAHDKAQHQETARFLQGLSSYGLREYDYLDAPHPVFYWQAILTDAQGNQVVQHTGVAWASPADGGTVSAYTTQRDAAAELAAISQPRQVIRIPVPCYTSFLTDFLAMF